jgi:hypothetical protein
MASRSINGQLLCHVAGDPQQIQNFFPRRSDAELCPGLPLLPDAGPL